ncbi:MAG TPA: GTP-binding protein [Puia sp.]|jgi:hypothetical protein|nr:GTP-binding protein [Puia sp.]
MIKKDAIVTIRYSMWNGRGDLLENNQATYTHGSSAISARLQSQLEGLQAGDSRVIHLKKGEEGADDDFTFEVFIDDVRETRAPLSIHLLSGFLGSGKTTAIAQACRFLAKKGVATGVITNDQGSRLVDGDLFIHLGIPSGQVTNGCFCCNYDDLEKAICFLSSHHGPSVLFAESVGSCTDLVATVLKPLLRRHPEWRPTISVFVDPQHTGTAFDPAISYIYNKQLEEAPLIIVTKTDLYPAARLAYADKTILYQNSFNDEDIGRWLQTLESQNPDLDSIALDYDLYGAGEAKLAWLDQQVEIISRDSTAQHAAISLIRRVSQTPYPIGHLKFLLDGHTKISITSTGATDHPDLRSAEKTTLLINARVQAEPAALSQLLTDAIRATETEDHCTIHTITESCFQPGYPRPTHRIA